MEICRTPPEQGNRVSRLFQAGFAAFGKEVQLISGPPYAETEKPYRLTSPIDDK